MTILGIGPELKVSEFHRPVFDMTLLRRVPPGPLRVENVSWSERRLECSLVRRPGLLAKIVGASTSANQLAARRQVLKVDMELRVEDSLHLFELKKPDQYTEFRRACAEIVRHWVARREGLRQGARFVHLWAICPVRWSRRRMVPRIPEGWSALLDSLTAAHLRGHCEATVRAIFYSVLTSDDGQFVILWRGGTSNARLEAVGRQLRLNRPLETTIGLLV